MMVARGKSFFGKCKTNSRKVDSVVSFQPTGCDNGDDDDDDEHDSYNSSPIE